MLFRDAGAIEKMREVDTLIVDKTGTLTEGKPAFDTALPPGYTADEVLRLAAGWTKAASILWQRPSSVQRKAWN